MLPDGVHLPVDVLPYPGGGARRPLRRRPPLSVRGGPVEQREQTPGVSKPRSDPNSFDPFAQHPFYSQMNHALVQRALARLDAAWPHGTALRVVDLASGTGAVTQLIVDELELFVRWGISNGRAC
jgi:hypothetical protein